jgi:hypothetical protein
MIARTYTQLPREIISYVVGDVVTDTDNSVTVTFCLWLRDIYNIEIYVKDINNVTLGYMETYLVPSTDGGASLVTASKFLYAENLNEPVF